MDGRVNNRTYSAIDYAGRKPKEDRIRTLSISALESIYGSEQKAFEHLAILAKNSFPHLKLLMEYAYGKPKVTKEIHNHVEQPLFPEVEYPMHKLSDATLKELIDINAEMEKESGRDY